MPKCLLTDGRAEKSERGNEPAKNSVPDKVSGGACPPKETGRLSCFERTTLGLSLVSSAKKVFQTASKRATTGHSSVPSWLQRQETHTSSCEAKRITKRASSLLRALRWCFLRGNQRLEGTFQHLRASPAKRMLVTRPFTPEQHSLSVACISEWHRRVSPGPFSLP